MIFWVFGALALLLFGRSTSAAHVAASPASASGGGVVGGIAMPKRSGQMSQAVQSGVKNAQVLSSAQRPSADLATSRGTATAPQVASVVGYRAPAAAPSAPAYVPSAPVYAPPAAAAPAPSYDPAPAPVYVPAAPIYDVGGDRGSRLV